MQGIVQEEAEREEMTKYNGTHIRKEDVCIKCETCGEWKDVLFSILHLKRYFCSKKCKEAWQKTQDEYR